MRLILVLVVVAAIAALFTGSLPLFAPVLILLALLARGVRPGERFLVCLIGRRRRAARRPPRRTAARSAILVRRVGRALAFALAMRPPPQILAVSD